MCLSTNYLTSHSSSLACAVCFLFVARPPSHVHPLILAHSHSLSRLVRTHTPFPHPLALFHMYDCTHAFLTYSATYIPYFLFGLVFFFVSIFGQVEIRDTGEVVIVSLLLGQNYSTRVHASSFPSYFTRFIYLVFFRSLLRIRVFLSFTQSRLFHRETEGSMAARFLSRTEPFYCLNALKSRPLLGGST